ncbi:MAG: hypothetical protein QXH97_00365 [Candidatus Bathyarchaeia archaeon]
MKVHVIDLSKKEAITAETVKNALEEALVKILPNKIHHIIFIETAGLIVIIYE